MTWVKICGITNIEDARAAVEAGADALGFVLYERSPRKVNAATVRNIVCELSSNVETVGVFVDENLDTMIDVARETGLKAFQVHQTHLFEPQARQDEQQPGPRAVCFQDLKMYIVLPARGLEWESSGFRLPFGIFLDSGTLEQPGGTGKTFDWTKAAPLISEMSKDVNVVVAGGLNTENVASAIRLLHPWGVDVSSGVEASPGKKDPQKVRAFIQAVREADKTT